MAAIYLTRGHDDGEIMGGSSGKIGFFGTTPVVQPSSASQAAVATSITTTATTTNLATQCAANSVLVNQLRAELVELGIIKGSA